MVGFAVAIGEDAARDDRGQVCGRFEVWWEVAVCGAEPVAAGKARPV